MATTTTITTTYAGEKKEGILLQLFYLQTLSQTVV